MKGIFVNCPYCKKLMAKNVYLRIGSFLTLKCFYCGEAVEISSESTGIIIKMLSKPDNLTEDDEDGTIFMHG